MTTSLFPETSGAEFSPCRRYRYRLWREVGGGPTLAVIGLNPSTADETEPDPTITRLMVRTRTLGFGRLMMLNLFAYRDTDPREMKRQVDPIGPGNNAAILAEAIPAAMVLCAWGNHGKYLNRDIRVVNLLTAAGIPLYALRITKEKQPEHPLYLPYEMKPVRWR